ncbi:MAG: tRNA (adenosine(37)-N6)-threonylcarbamoyltransferase complex transferase subunit TsaD [Candidatus Hydrothermae bacterium]|nr:tRNA (adenosine(37)-N6)-threonylcarbamoyltransferase complex transferase subunit TsaD [Candidatus Hydrothermae bacterium]
MRVLAFETSCDETSASVVESPFRVLSNVTKTQEEHREFGGVVPEVASRAHMRLIWPITERALEKAGVELGSIDGIAFTYGPGLIGALLVGIVFGKTVAQVIGRDFIGINHLEGHLFSLFLSHPHLEPPVLYLLVSGGHTELVWMPEFFRYEVLGHTLDDAAGEAFDKVAKMLGLSYPGGPEIDRLAKTGDPDFHRFPRARVGGFDFSFSGVKTSVLYYLRDNDADFARRHLADIAASFQEAVVDMLLSKTLKAAKKLHAEKVAVVGGVSLNSRLREKFKETLGKITRVYFPEPQYCGDNAAMIGAAALMRFERGERSPLTLSADPDLRLL